MIILASRFTIKRDLTPYHKVPDARLTDVKWQSKHRWIKIDEAWTGKGVCNESRQKWTNQESNANAWIEIQIDAWGGFINSYSASHDNWCIATLWNMIMTAQCEEMGEVGSARYEPALLPPCPSIRVLNYSNCQRSTHFSSRAWQSKC